MINVIIKENLIDKEFIKNRTEGFEKLKEIIKKYTPEYASKICGVDKELIIESAKIYGNAERASIIYCMGVTQFTHGVDAVKALCNLAMITGNIGKEGTGVNPLRGRITFKELVIWELCQMYFLGIKRLKMAINYLKSIGKLT